MSHRIVQFRMVVGAYERLRELTKVALRKTRWTSFDARWNESACLPAPLADVVREALARDPAAAGAVEERDMTELFELGYTEAPRTYDWLGTVELEVCAGEVRLVAVRREHVEAQRARYGRKPLVPIADAPGHFGKLPSPLRKRMAQEPLFLGVEPEPPAPPAEQIALLPDVVGPRPRGARRPRTAPAPASITSTDSQANIPLPGDQITM